MKRLFYRKFFGMLCAFSLMLSSAMAQSKYSADSLFNEGNKALSENRLDEAIFNYECALLLDPLSEDISINLRLANEKLSTDIIEIESFFLAKWWSNISNIFLPGGWKIASILIMIFCLILLFVILFKRTLTQNRLFRICLSALIFCLFISILAGISRQKQIVDNGYAIVFGEDQFLYQGPDMVSEQIKGVTGGNKVKILGSDGEWFKVSTLDREQGWILKERLRLIRFDM